MARSKAQHRGFPTDPKRAGDQAPVRSWRSNSPQAPDLGVPSLHVPRHAAQKRVEDNSCRPAPETQCSERHTPLAQTTSLPQANKKGPREPLILRPELRSSDPTHAGGHSPKKGAGGCGSLGLSPRRVLRGYPIGLGSDTGRPWPEPQLETLNSRWWTVCTEWKAGVPVQEARSPQQLSQKGLVCFNLARGLQALQHPTCAL